MDILGFPVGIRRVSELAALPLILLMSSGCIVQQCFRRPAQGKPWAEKFARRIGSCLDQCLKCLPLWGREVYKILFSQRGIIILLLFVYVALGMAHNVPLQAGSEQEAYERQYLVQLQGDFSLQLNKILPFIGLLLTSGLQGDIMCNSQCNIDNQKEDNDSSYRKHAFLYFPDP